MSVVLAGGTIHLASPTGVEDTEPLVCLLQADRSRPVDLTHAGPLHAAIVQALLVFRPAVIGTGGDAFMERWLMPLLAGTPEPAVVEPRPAVPETP